MSAHPDADLTAPRPTIGIGERGFDGALSLLLLLALLYNLYFFFVGIDNPVLDMFAFRQTQTALSAYWLDRDGLRIIYETPVLGHPWAIPFEFPLYQWLMVLLSRLGLSLDVAGRIVSFAFHLGLLFPLAALLRTLRVNPRAIVIIAILFLASPLYVFWGRSVMIESCALFFAIAWLACLAALIARGGAAPFVGAVICGSLAAVVKVTTFTPIGLLGAALFLGTFLTDWRRNFGRHLSRTLLVVAAGIVPVAIGALWVSVSDGFKVENPFGARLASDALARFNFGSLEMRLGGEFWRDAVAIRMLPEILGYGAAVGLILFGAWLYRPRYAAVVAGSIAGFLIAILIFTNLHRVHNYYQYANGVFLLVALGAVIGALAEQGRKAIAMAGLFLILGGQAWYFLNNHATWIYRDARNGTIFKLSELIHQNTAEDEGLVVFGWDWSSELPYYAQRRSLAVPGWASEELFQRVIDDPEQFFGGMEIGAIAYCFPEKLGKRAALVDGLVARLAQIAEVGSCRLFSWSDGKSDGGPPAVEG